MNDATDRTLVWDLPTRVFHWTLAAMFAAGSTPRAAKPRAMTCWSRYPSLLAISTIRADGPTPDRAMAASTCCSAWRTHVSLVEDR